MQLCICWLLRTYSRKLKPIIGVYDASCTSRKGFMEYCARSSHKGNYFSFPSPCDTELGKMKEMGSVFKRKSAQIFLWMIAFAEAWSFDYGIISYNIQGSHVLKICISVSKWLKWKSSFFRVKTTFWTWEWCSLGFQFGSTSPSSNCANHPFWNKHLVCIAAEPFGS